MRQGTLWTAVLLTPLFAGCVGGSVEFTQAGMADIRSVSIHMEGVDHTWSPEAEHGQGIALNSLLALYPAQPAEDAANLSHDEADRLLEQHETVTVELVDDPETVLADTHNETRWDIRAVHFLFENGTEDPADPELLVCGPERCQPWTTTEDLGDLRAQAEEGAEAVKQG